MSDLKDFWFKIITYCISNWGKIIIVLTAIGGYTTGGVQYIEKTEKVDQLKILTEKIEALEVGPIQVFVPPKVTKGITLKQCEEIAKEEMTKHIKSRRH